jgi:uncharacterized cupredoxin-like copper-binding protein
MDLKQYGQTIRRLASALDPESAALDNQELYVVDRTHLDMSQKEIWLMSLENPSVGSKGGQVVSAHPMNAARMMHERTHREATLPEIQQHKANLELRREQTEIEESERKGISTKKLLEMFVAAQQPAAAARAGGKDRQ